MIAYTYDSDGYFSGVVQCQKDPKNLGEYLNPINSTKIQPPEQNSYSADQTPIFNIDQQKWLLVESKAKKENDRVLLETYNHVGVQLYEQDENGKVVLRDQKQVESETEILEKEELINTAENQMNSNIFEYAKQVTKGITVETVLAHTHSYQVRMQNPSRYTQLNLKVHYAFDSYTYGDLLDTEEKIKNYYTDILINMDTFRQNEIQKFLDYKSSLN